MKRNIIISLIGIAVLMPLGLISRQIGSIPNEIGDALWAMMVFCIWRIILHRKKLSTIALISLISAFLVEFSQLITWPFLVAFRKTFVGHMMLGQGFLWIDLLAYTIGIICVFGIFKVMGKKTIKSLIVC
ncbi:MAG: DUF2809 domain-containing protein [Bacteroidales bacterium]|nr:DUF2809 domain-containing protein [Bacteroidales bacterium]